MFTFSLFRSVRAVTFMFLFWYLFIVIAFILERSKNENETLTGLLSLIIALFIEQVREGPVISL